MNIYKQIYKEIKKADTIVIARHIGPDPDALGSSLGLKELILNTFPEKKVYVIGNPTNKFKFMGSLDKIDEDTQKDLLIVKTNLKTLSIILFVFIFMTFNGNFDLIFVLPFILIMTFVSTFSYDDFNNFNAYAVSLPSGRKNIVKSKYIASILLIITSSLIGLVLSLTIMLINNKVDIESIMSSLIGCLLGIVIIISIMYPLIFKYGSEKGRIVLFISIFLITIIASISTQFIEVEQIKDIFKFIENYVYIIIPIFTVSTLSMSYLISQKIYLNKEF